MPKPLIHTHKYKKAVGPHKLVLQVMDVNMYVYLFGFRPQSILSQVRGYLIAIFTFLLLLCAAESDTVAEIVVLE